MAKKTSTATPEEVVAPVEQVEETVVETTIVEEVVEPAAEEVVAPVDVTPEPEPVVEEPKSEGPEFKTAHVQDWTFCKKGGFFPGIQKKLKENIGDFNFSDAYNRPTTIRFRQTTNDTELDTKNGKVFGKAGDYLFMDCVGGKTIVPYLIFKMAEF